MKQEKDIFLNKAFERIKSIIEAGDDTHKIELQLKLLKSDIYHLQKNFKPPKYIPKTKRRPEHNQPDLFTQK